MNQSSRTLLIVDDSPEDRELYRRYLLRSQEYSYTILEATLGCIGLEMWQQHQPDALLLDYRLPDLDGLEFLAKLQLSPQQPYFPVIMMTGYGNETIAVQAMKAGAQDYLVKGEITPERLQLAVNGAIQRVQLHTQLQQRIERERVVAQITQKIHQTLDLAEILQTTVTEVRQFLQADRVLIFRLHSDGWGTVTTESVGTGWTSLMSASYHDPCLNQDYFEHFRQGLVTQKSDIHDGSIDKCHVELLEKLQVRANLVVPILQNGELWGMLIAHHCASPRQWQPLEVDLLKELAIQAGIALVQAELYQQAQKELIERRRVEAQLRHSEERFRTSVENMLDCFGIYRALRDEEGRIVDFQTEYINDAAYFNNQMTRQEQDDRGLCELLPGNPINGLWDECSSVVETGQALVKESSIYEDDCGQQRLVKAFDIRIAKLGDGFVATWRDITDRQQAQIERANLLEQEQAARALAERANQAKDEFLAMLSHELRTPLNPILGWAKLLQTTHFDAVKTAKALATIERNAKLQAQLIDDLLDVAKIVPGKLTIHGASVNLVSVVECAIDTVKTSVVAKSIRLHLVLPPIAPVFGDAARLQQVVWNLLSNAIKFTPYNGRVEIRLERVGEIAQMTVSDTGKGIKPEFIPHIFESFRQEDLSITRKYGGLGLGLTIVRSLVEAHGGTIVAASNGEGQGATFTVCLPLQSGDLDISGPDESPVPELDLTGIRVLAVDDQPDTRDFFTVLLARYGAEVLTVGSAAEALVSMESFQPDVLVTDIGMPEIDGYALLQQIRSLPVAQGGQIPAIALTAYASEEDRRRSLECGFQDHMSKPLDINKLVKAISDRVRAHKKSNV